MIARLGDSLRTRSAVLGGGLSLALVFGSIGLDSGIANAATDGAGTPTQSIAALAPFPSVGVEVLPTAPLVTTVEADSVTITWPTALEASAPISTALVLLVLASEDSPAGSTPVVALQPSAEPDPAADAASLAAGLPVLTAGDDAVPEDETTVARIAGLQAASTYRFALRSVPTDPSVLAIATSPAAESPASATTTTLPAAAEPVADTEDPVATPAPAGPAPTEPTASASPHDSGVDTAIPPSGAPARDATTDAPGTPEAPKGKSAGAGAIELSWPAVAAGAPVRTYTVTVLRDGALVRSIPGIDPLTAGTTTLITGLLANTSYTFTVTAVGAEGSSRPSSASSPVTTAKGAATAPTQARLAPLPGDPLGLVASWSAPSSDGGYAITGYTVELFTGSTVSLANLVSRTEVDAARTSIELPRIGIVGSSLSIRVTASNGAGEASSSLSAAHRLAATAPVTTRVGTPTVSEGSPTGSLRITWTAPGGTTERTGYLVRVAAADGLSTAMTAAVIDLGGDFARTGALETTIENPAPGRRVSVQITAYESESFVGLIPRTYRTSSLRSASIGTTGASVPQRPDRPLAVTSDGVDRITIAGTTIPTASGNGDPITAFDLVVYRAGTSEAVTTKRVPAVVSADDPSRLTHEATTVTGLSLNTAYTVRAAAVNAVGAGPASAASAIVTTLATPPPGSVAPEWQSLDALRAGVGSGSVSEVAAADAALASSVEPTTTLEPLFTWPGSARATGGEVWLFGSAADDRAPVYLGPFTVTAGTARASVAIGELEDGDYALAFVPTVGRAAAIEFAVASSHGGPTEVDDAVLRWGFSNEANNGAFFGGCNFLTAGHIPDVGSGTIVDQSRYSAQSGDVSIEKPNSAGAYELASFATRCLDRSGSTVDSNVTSSFTDSQLVIVGGAGTVDPSTNSGTIRWTGDFSVAFYGGLTYWYGSNPVLTVVDGVGTLTATASGFGTDMQDQTKWTQIPPREIVLATLVGVTMRSDGFTVSPSYVGVKISQGDQVAPNSSNASYWGSFPQSFIDFQSLTGQFSYWFSSGGRQDPGKVALPLTVGFDASTFVAVPPAGTSAGDVVDLVPNAKRSPFALRTPGAPAAAAATGIGRQVTEVITLIQPATAPVPASQAVPLFIALLGLLGGLTVVAAAGGGLIAAGVLKP
ncbi:MAG TPA: fibronectin type III domain-containing protein [Plantibacter sp.]|uniref:fibronectin type III domain-containing protein n=1 Tax=unclassified Plantibacter TaxID=2624265 RepID=UPI002C129E4D|nr:fibronectin type III domain-containing protein [Plantibacter sp.]